MPPKTAIVERETVSSPAVFSFPLPQNTSVPAIDGFLPFFEANRDFLNHLFSGKSIPGDQRQKLPEIHNQLINANEEINELIDQNQVTPILLECNAFLNLANYSILNYVPNASDVERRNCLLGVTLTLKNPAHRTSTSCWYYAVACIELYDKSKIEYLLSETAGVLPSITSAPHKAGIYSLIIHRLTEIKKAPATYPESTLFVMLNGSLTHHTWTHEGLCASTRHSYVLQNELQNHSYFDPQYSNDPAQMTQCRDLLFKILKENSIILQQRVIKESISDGHLLKFAAQLGGVAPASPVFKVSGATPAQESVFNGDLITRMYENELVTSEGFLLKTTYENEAKYKIFQQIVTDCYTQHIGTPSDQAALDALLDSIKQTFIQDEAQSLGHIRKRLAGMASQRALLLYQQALDTPAQHGLPEPLRKNVQQMVQRCLEIFALAESIKDSKQSDPQKHKDWFNLSQQVVDHCITKKSDLLISVGKPEVSNEETKGHAIYVAIKWKNDTVQVIITNGGYGAQRFHKKLENTVENDRHTLHYAAFKPFELTIKNKEALTHYIYKLITMRYTVSVDMDDPGPYGFWQLYGNIYLKEKDVGYYFDGCNGKTFTQFEREDLEKTYLAQFHGNCTIHNLSRSIKILFDMDELNFGLLEDNLLLGTDAYISKCGAAPASQRQISSMRL